MSGIDQSQTANVLITEGLPTHCSLTKTPHNFVEKCICRSMLIGCLKELNQCADKKNPESMSLFEDMSKSEEIKCADCGHNPPDQIAYLWLRHGFRLVDSGY